MGEKTQVFIFLYIWKQSNPRAESHWNPLRVLRFSTSAVADSPTILRARQRVCFEDGGHENKRVFLPRFKRETPNFLKLHVVRRSMRSADVISTTKCTRTGRCASIRAEHVLEQGDVISSWCL